MTSYYERAEFLLTHTPQDRLAEFFRNSPVGKTCVELVAVGMMAQDDRKPRNAATEETPNSIYH
jgi:hypothetical protein